MSASHDPASADSSTSPARKRVVLIGLRPSAVDFSTVPGMNAEKLLAGLEVSRAALAAAGFDAQWCLVDAEWDSAGPEIAAALAERPPAAVLIGAGIRVFPAHFLLFERIINLAHERAPGARLCFSTAPDSAPEAVLRWVSP